MGLSCWSDSGERSMSSSNCTLRSSQCLPRSTDVEACADFLTPSDSIKKVKTPASDSMVFQPPDMVSRVVFVFVFVECVAYDFLSSCISTSRG